MVIFRGVSLTIIPLLALGADQDMKVDVKAKISVGDDMAIHLDEVHSEVDKGRLINIIFPLLP